MSDYTLAVNWSGKDALSDSDAAKVISGSDFNTEFTTIRTAVNSKLIPMVIVERILLQITQQ